MFNVGDVEVRRIEESLGHGFQPNVLLPDWTPKDIERAGGFAYLPGRG
jgi:hypothetical protein